VANVFQPLESDQRGIDFEFEGTAYRAFAGGSVAAALLGVGVTAFRHTPVSGSLRGPFCLMGACFDCLVEIDGEPNQQACMIQLREGMRITRMRLEPLDE
jgi:D-hydroxyproline dehydrogenase subunit gamma